MICIKMLQILTYSHDNDYGRRVEITHQRGLLGQKCSNISRIGLAIERNHLYQRLSIVS